MHDPAHQKVIENIDVYLYTKTNFINLFFHKRLNFKKILQFDWSRAFWRITQEPEFCQIIRGDIHTHVATLSVNLTLHF